MFLKKYAQSAHPRRSTAASAAMFLGAECAASAEQISLLVDAVSSKVSLCAVQALFVMLKRTVNFDSLVMRKLDGADLSLIHISI